MRDTNVVRIKKSSFGFLSGDLPIITSSVLALMTFFLSISYAKAAKIEVQGAGADQLDHKVVIFHGTDGKETKRITLNGGDTPDGKRKFVDALVSDDGSRVVTAEEVKDQKERDPFKIRGSSSVAMTWYDADGNTVCALQTRAMPRLIAGGGRAIVAIDMGFAPEAFETGRYDTRVRSTAELKENLSLTDYYLYVMNDSCQVVFSTVSAKGGWNTFLISPSGAWILLEEFESQVPSPQGWKYYLSVVNIRDGRKWTFDHGRIDLRGIADDGTVKGRKYLGESPNIYDYVAANGKKHRVHKSRLQYFQWKPGLTAFETTGGELEEEK